MTRKIFTPFVFQRYPGFFEALLPLALRPTPWRGALLFGIMEHSEDPPPNPPFARGGVRGSLRLRTASPLTKGGWGGGGARALAGAQAVCNPLYASRWNMPAQWFGSGISQGRKSRPEVYSSTDTNAPSRSADSYPAMRTAIESHAMSGPDWG